MSREAADRHHRGIQGNYNPLTCIDVVSEGQGLPIGHGNEISLTRTFVLGAVR